MTLPTSFNWLNGCVSAAGTRIFLTAIQTDAPSLCFVYVYDWNVTYWLNVAEIAVTNCFLDGAAVATNAAGDVVCYAVNTYNSGYGAPQVKLAFSKIDTAAAETQSRLFSQNIYATATDLFNVARISAPSVSYDNAPVEYQWYRRAFGSNSFTLLFSENSDVLEINNPTDDDYAAEYKVVASFAYSTRTEETNSVKLVKGENNGLTVTLTLAAEQPENASIFIAPALSVKNYCYFGTYNDRAVLFNGLLFVYYLPAREVLAGETTSTFTEMPPTWNIGD